MIYRDFEDIQLSALGLGCMRLPVIDGDDSRIDVAATEEMIEYAMANGINYYDVAYGYHGGNAENVVPGILKKYSRDSYYLATKFPGYDPAVFKKVSETFEEQIAKTGVDCFDFYLLHNVCEMNVDAYLDPAYGVLDYMLEQKRQGRIKRLGFSSHGDAATIAKFLDACGDEMEFCMIELNYFDYKFQDARAKVELLNERNIPIWVMEPVRGGQLANLAEEHSAKLAEAAPGRTQVEWAFRFLQGLPGVTMVLTGSSSLAQLKENIATYAEEKPLDEGEVKLLDEIAGEMIARMAIPCTGCKYCISHCPMELDIPFLLKLQNESAASGAGFFIAPMAISSIDKEKWSDKCIGCGACQQVCPQRIAIPDELAKLTGTLNQYFETVMTFDFE